MLRTDFNQDNAKLDAVLEGFPFIQLARVEAETPTQQLDLDLSNEDLTKYSGYWLYIQLPAVTTKIKATLNKATAYYSGSATTNSSFYEGTSLLQVSSSEWGAFLSAVQFAISHNSGSAGYFLTSERSNFYFHASDRGGSLSRGICCLSDLEGLVLSLSPDEEESLVPSGTKAILYGLKW